MTSPRFVARQSHGGQLPGCRFVSSSRLNVSSNCLVYMSCLTVSSNRLIIYMYSVFIYVNIYLSMYISMYIYVYIYTYICIDITYE